MYKLLELKDIPTIVFAHQHISQNYDHEFRPAPNRIELTVQTQGTVLRIYPDGSSLTIPQNSFLSTISDHSFRMHSQPLYSPISHYTVAFEAPFVVRDISEEELLDFNLPPNPGKNPCPMQALLTECMPLQQHSAYLESLLKRIVKTHIIQTPVSRARCIGMIFELLAGLTDEVLRTSVLTQNDFAPSSILYVTKVIEYISSHLSKKITIHELTQLTDVSPSYLSGLFKAYTGQSIIDYINRLKIERIKEMMISDKNLRLKEAGERVGITDENYLSRLFKRYVGMSLREFQHMI